MKTLRPNRPTFNLLKRGIAALEEIAEELQRYNELREAELGKNQTAVTGEGDSNSLQLENRDRSDITDRDGSGAS